MAALVVDEVVDFLSSFLLSSLSVAVKADAGLEVEEEDDFFPADAAPLPPPPLPPPPQVFFFFEVVGVDLSGGRDLAVGVLEEEAPLFVPPPPPPVAPDEGLEREPRFLSTSGLRRASSLWDRLKLSVR